MITPAGKECQHYHEDFHRGRNIQECRLVQENPKSARWTPGDCFKCPVPDILQANASRDMKLTLTISARLLRLGRKLEIAAHCTKHDIPIEDPYTGCPIHNEERPGFDVFRRALEQDDDD